MDQITINHLLKSPHVDVANGYLYVDPRVKNLLGIQSGFNTFAEVYDDLQLINRKLWFAGLTHLHQPGMITYEIRGHGFLIEMD